MFRWIAALAAALTAAGLSPAPPAAPEVKAVKVGPGVVLEIEGAKRRVLVEAKVILRKGAMEGLLTRSKKNKDHEYILSCDADARLIHTALLAAGAKAGAPVAFEPRFRAPAGGRVRVSVRYKKGGRVVVEDATTWFRDVAKKKALPETWVFAGSFQGADPENESLPPNYYMANHGDVITVVNVPRAMLDLPFESPKPPGKRLFEANTERIPEVDTAVELILEPLAAAGQSPKR